MRRLFIAPILLVLTALSTTLFAQDAAHKSAEALFAQYVALEANFDPRLADLYADEARITSRRTFPMGDPIDSFVASAEYKAQLRQFLAAAKTRDERYRYSRIAYASEGAYIRIDAQRYSEVKGRRSPISLLVGPSSDGSWRIFEELSELR